VLKNTLITAQQHAKNAQEVCVTTSDTKMITLMKVTSLWLELFL